MSGNVMPDWIGYQWLIERFGLKVTEVVLVETVIGATRASTHDGDPARWQR